MSRLHPLPTVPPHGTIIASALMTALVWTSAILALGACQSRSPRETAPPSPASNAKSAVVPYSEFEKVMLPSGSILPLAGGKESLLILARPGDAYPKLYSIDHESRELKLRLDVGRPIYSLTRDHLAKHYYVSIDNDGDENYTIYRFDPSVNKVAPMLGNPGFRARIQDYSPDGETLYVLSNHENKAIYSLYKIDRETRLYSRLTDGKTSYDWAIVSEDGQTVALAQALGNYEIRVWLLKIGQGPAKPILSRKATVYEPAFFHPNNQELFINTNQGRDRSACAKVKLSEPRKLIWVRTEDDRDIECTYNRTTKLTAVSESYDGQVKLRLFSGVLETELPLPIPDRTVVSHLSGFPGDSRIYVRLVAANDPGDIYRFDLKDGASARLDRVSNFNLSSIPKENFAQSFDLHYKSFDGKRIHALVFARPEWLTDGKKRPVILWPHGGPDSQVMHDYQPYFQYWALNGFVILAPNFRGSTGYGTKFERLNDRDWGGGHIKDLIWAKRALKDLSYAHMERVFIVGRSFGGYSVLSAITRYPNEFKGAVAMVAIANLETFFKSIPPDPAWQSEFRTELGDPVKDAKLYRSRSPYYSADKVKIPLKIYQSENDVRTVKAEMDAFVDRLNQLKIPVQYEVLAGEGHSFQRAETWERVLEGTVHFLNGIQ